MFNGQKKAINQSEHARCSIYIVNRYCDDEYVNMWKYTQTEEIIIVVIYS